MPILSLFYAIIVSSVFIYFYIKSYMRYFYLRKYFYVGIIFLLISIYLQFLNYYIFDFNVLYISLLSFITYPISLSLIYKTNIFNILFLALNAILKIYIAFVFFGTIYAINNNIQYSYTWIYTSKYFNLSQGHAYLLSIGSLLIVDNFLLKNKLKDFFQLKRNLLLIIFIQLILLTNMIWLSISNAILPHAWYNVILIIMSFSIEIIYFLLRVFTVNSSYFSSYKTHSETLRKQLSFQLEHYKNYEDQMENFMKFKHDYDKVLTSISNLLAAKDYKAVSDLVSEYGVELNSLNIDYKKYSNNLILDALLNDYAKRFERIDANFSSFTYITLNEMSELKLIKLFYNILENAYEALLNVSEPNNRIIKIDSEVLDNYIKISIKNTTNNKFINLDQKTSKLDSKNHGFGLSIINDILNEYNAFYNRFITNEDGLNYYNLEIFLPKN